MSLDSPGVFFNMRLKAVGVLSSKIAFLQTSHRAISCGVFTDSTSERIVGTVTPAAGGSELSGCSPV